MAATAADAADKAPEPFAATSETEWCSQEAAPVIMLSNLDGSEGELAPDPAPAASAPAGGDWFGATEVAVVAGTAANETLGTLSGGDTLAAGKLGGTVCAAPELKEAGVCPAGGNGDAAVCSI
mmetsp:Transcript_52212/g.111152  ORF Transcript_52212/g.111152 Transcript_52212/m.111152 type:complete len:123 (-) Transcript_52212:690-1058(-)